MAHDRAPGPPEKAGGAGTPVIVVDDDPVSAELVQKVLGRNGWVVHVASTGEEALDMLRRDVARYVLTDVRMPGMSGVELARRAAAEHPGVRLVAVTAFADDLAQAVQAGLFEGVLEKPINVDTLPGTLDWLFLRRHLV